jgi:hypothetical protein
VKHFLCNNHDNIKNLDGHSNMMLPPIFYSLSSSEVIASRVELECMLFIKFSLSSFCSSCKLVGNNPVAVPRPGRVSDQTGSWKEMRQPARTALWYLLRFVEKINWSWASDEHSFSYIHEYDQ